jgi:hypothetical protein
MTPKLGLYIEFDLTKEEENVAQTFNTLQKAYLQNLRYECVMQRDRLVPDFEHPSDYFFAKAQLDGRIDQLTELIDLIPDSASTVTEAN